MLLYKHLLHTMWDSTYIFFRLAIALIEQPGSFNNSVSSCNPIPHFFKYFLVKNILTMCDGIGYFFIDYSIFQKIWNELFYLITLRRGNP